MDTSRVDGVKAPQHFKTPMVHDDVRQMFSDGEAVSTKCVDRLDEHIPELDGATVAPNSYGWRSRPHTSGPDPLVDGADVFQFYRFPRT